MEVKSDFRAVSIIGAGTIGLTVGRLLAAGTVEGLLLSGFLVRRDQPDLIARALTGLDELLVPGGVVVEAAGHDAVRRFGEDVLAAGCDLVCVSVGALADAELRRRLQQAAVSGGARLVIPSGAIGGLDVLRAAAQAGLDEVTIEQRKPPAALLPASDAERLEEPKVLFDGTAAEVVRAYPKSTNVAAAVAMAGLGFDRTRAIVVADPSLAANQARLTARGSFGTLSLRLDNVATANPQTSAITAYSVIAALRALVEPVVVPG